MTALRLRTYSVSSLSHLSPSPRKAMADSDGLSFASSGFFKIFRNTSAKIKSRISRSAKSKVSKSQYPSLPEGLLRRFSLAEIKAAIAEFSGPSLIGWGGFGSIYKGVIDNGSLIVTIRRLMPRTSLKFVISAFRTEVLLLCQLRHPNIVDLIGLCLEDGEHFLVYEYMSKGGLDRHLFGANYELHWKRRLEICIGVARGLHYLHTGLKRVVIHRDFKTSNILIDDNWGAKISAFALSKLGPNTVSPKPLVFKKDIEDIVGTCGYMAPEYAMEGEMSTQSDVFAFGVVLLEILSGTPVTDYSNNRNLIPWSGENIENGTVYEIVDPLLRGKVASECLKIFLEIADSCLAMEADERPMIGEVETTLELVLELQSKADSEMETTNINQNGAAFGYEEVAFHPPDSSNLVKWNRYISFF